MVRIGIDLGGTKIEGIALDATGTVLWRERVSAPRADYRLTLDAIAAMVQRIEAELGVRASVGVGTPGSASPASGRMRNCNSTWLNGERLREDLCEKLAREVRIANDADCFTLSEATDGAAAGAGVVFGVILGTGVGGGVCVDGRLLAGPNAIAGEWGHNLFAGPRGDLSSGRACYCGRRDCVETWLSGPGLARSFLEMGARGSEFFRTDSDGDPGVRMNSDLRAPASVPGKSDEQRTVSVPGKSDEQRTASDPGKSDERPTALVPGKPDTRPAASGGVDSHARGQDVAALAAAGDPLALRTLELYAEQLAFALAQIVNVLDPQVIVLGGGLSNIARLYDDVPARWGRYVFSDVVRTRLERARFGDSSGVRGAAWLFPLLP